MDAQVEAALNDIVESFKYLGQLEQPLISIDQKTLSRLREFHRERIRLNLQSLLKRE